MPVSLTYLEACAAESGYSMDTMERVIRLGELAAGIAGHPLLGQALVLKGGTALNLCFDSAPDRLSVDLDYNYIGQMEREAMRAERPQIEGALNDLVRRSGFRLQQSADSFAGRTMYAMYHSVLGGEGRIEVDLNYLWRSPLVEMEERSLWQPGALDRPRVRTVALPELLAGKMLAFLDRSAPRDVWDIGHFTNRAADALRRPFFRCLFIALAATLPHPLATYTRDRIAARLSARSIEEQLMPMLATDKPPAPETLLDAAWQVMAPFVSLASNEQRYIDAIHEGSIEPALLFPDDAAMAQRIAEHPAIRWKVVNIIEMQQGGPTATNGGSPSWR